VKAPSGVMVIEPLDEYCIPPTNTAAPALVRLPLSGLPVSPVVPMLVSSFMLPVTVECSSRMPNRK
jgi:hypothetical protein